MMNLDQLINKYDIKCVHVSQSLEDFSRIFQIQKYSINFNKLNTLFFGVYRKEDIDLINNHKGNSWILWYDNDCNPEYYTRKNNVNFILKKNNLNPFKMHHLTHCNKTSKYLNYFKINHQIINLEINNNLSQSVNNCNIDTNFSNYGNFNDFYNNTICKYDKIFVTLQIIPWDIDLFQRPQHVAISFAKLGWLSIYMDDSIDTEYKNIAPNLWIVKDDYNLLSIKNAFYSLYSTTYLNYNNNLISQIKSTGGIIIYEYIDDINPKISGSDSICNILEINKKTAFMNCDLLVATSKILYEECIQANKQSILIPNGVSTNHYECKKGLMYKEEKYSGQYKLLLEFKIKYDIICGFFGAIAPWLDYNMINDIVDKRKDIGFIFIGPDYQYSISNLPQSENFLYINSINYEVLPYFSFLFDICIIPFEEGDIAKTTSPLKLYEYCAMQKPIITSSYMQECIKYKEILSYSNLNEFSDSINVAIKNIHDQEFKKSISNIANENDWINLVTKYSEVLLSFLHV